MNTKKILLYSGGALVVGAVGFFVWSFFQKVSVPTAQPTAPLVDDSATPKNTTPVNSGSNPFTSMLNTTFEPIKTPTIQSDLDWLMTKT